MSSLSLIFAGLGAVAAAVGSGVLLARCFRGPRADVIAWSVALLGLLISLGSQVLGYAVGFDGAMFRAMELGGQVIAPLALILALSEVAARGLAARFCARVYIPALAIVAVVVLTLDQLASVTFTKAWPDPAVFYEAPPKYVLMFAIAPVTVLVTLIAVGVVIARSGEPGWNAVLPAQLAGGTAAVLLAYPALTLLVNFGTRVNLPVHSVFSLLCAVATGLIWYAGVRTGRLRLGALHGRGSGRAVNDGDGWGSSGWRGGDDPGDFDRRADSGRADSRRDGSSRNEPGRRSDYDQPAEAGDWDDYGRRGDFDRSYQLDQTGDLDRYGGDPEQGVYRGSGLYRADRAGDSAREVPERDDEYGYGWQPGDDQDGGRGEPDGGFDERDGGFDDRHGGFDDRDGFGTGDFDFGHEAPGWDDRPGDDTPPARPGSDLPVPGYPGQPMGEWPGSGRESDTFAAGGPAGPEGPRAELFGQIAIYTLLEDRVHEFDQLTERVVGLVRSSEPDTLVFIIHAVPSAPMQRILYEVYRDRDAYERHRQQPYVVRFEADRRPYVLATNVIELGLQQAKVTPFPSVSELFGEPGYDTSGFERPDYLRDYGRPSASQDGPTRSW
jgi:quinol monooxygenase YgiN